MFVDKPKFPLLHKIAALFMLFAIIFVYDAPELPGVSKTFTLTLTPIDTVIASNNVTGGSEVEYREAVALQEKARRLSREFKHINYEEAVRLLTVINDHAEKKDLTKELVLAVIATESSFNKKAISGEGAKGYMQVMPKWHRDKLNGRDPYNVLVNIEVGTQILSNCFKERSTYKGALACYNGAVTPGRADEFLLAVNSNHQKLNRLMAGI